MGSKQQDFLHKEDKNPKLRHPVSDAFYETPSFRVDGQLVEFKAKKKVPMSEKQAFYSELLGMAQERGFADGWCAHKYRDKFGVWPAKLERIPKRPGKAVRDFEYESRKKFMKEKKVSA